MNNIPVFKFAVREDLLKHSVFNFLPTKSEPFATGWDVKSAQTNQEDMIIRPGQYFKIPLGFRALPPEGWWFYLHPRSSSFAKKYMHNLIGVIDEHYSQEVLFAGQYIPDVNSMGHDLIIKFGEKIGQIVPIKRVEMEIDSLSNKEYDDLCSKRMAVRQGGFGSTDIK
jgi:dUTPase